MMRKRIQRNKKWLLVLSVVLLIGVVLTFPAALGNTWAWVSSGVDHELTYRSNELTWGDSTDIRPDGTAVLQLFSDRYGDAVEAADGAKVVAPGLESGSTIRLVNNDDSGVQYTATVYRIAGEDVPIRANIHAAGAVPTVEGVLPEGVLDGQIMQVVTGRVESREYVDMDVSWAWDYEQGQDAEDTALTVAEIAENVTVGVYVVVTDEVETPSPLLLLGLLRAHKPTDKSADAPTDEPTDNTTVITPKTADESYTVLWCIAAVLVLLMLAYLLTVDRWDRRQER